MILLETLSSYTFRQSSTVDSIHTYIYKNLYAFMFISSRESLSTCCNRLSLHDCSFCSVGLTVLQTSGCQPCCQEYCWILAVRLSLSCLCRRIRRSLLVLLSGKQRFIILLSFLGFVKSSLIWLYLCRTRLPCQSRNCWLLIHPVSLCSRKEIYIAGFLSLPYFQ